MKKRLYDSHEGLCTKNHDAFPSHASLDSELKNPPLLFSYLSFFFIPLFRQAALGNGRHARASRQRRRGEMKRGREGVTDIQLGEGLHESRVGLMWITAHGLAEWKDWDGDCPGVSRDG